MNSPIRRLLFAAASAGLPLLAAAAPTEIHNEPLTNAASAPAPNIMFIFDDSGSMMFQHSPDYTTDYLMFNSNGTVSRDAGSPICFDYKDDDNAITTTPANGTVANAKLKTCSLGDPPLMSAQFNKQYYDPAIRYYPAVNHDGTERISMTAANTANWTQVPTDAYGIQNSSQIETERSYTNTSGATTVNLVTGYPDRLWCTERTATATSTDDAVGSKTGIPNGPLCVKNSAYSYPNNTYGYGRNSGTTTTKFVYGAPYYYTIPVTEYCTTANLKECVNANEDGTNPSPETHTFAARVRWCADSGTTVGGVNQFSKCQGKRIDGYLYPKTFGRVVAGASSPAARAKATLTIGTGLHNTVYTITAISVDGMNLLSGPISASTGLDTTTKRNALAQAIATAIAANSGSTGYTATRTNQTVTVEATSAGATPNGKALVVAANLIATAAATATLTVEAVSSGSNITSLTVNGSTALIGGTVNCNYSDSPNNRNTCASNLTTAINNYTSTSGYSATRSSATVTITAPLALGSTPNGWPLRETGSVNTTADNATAPTFSGGATSPPPYTVTAFSGGSEYESGLPRVGVAPFSRMDIVDDGRTFPQSKERSDCGVKGHCTYDEEMTNFANWYAYYRTRMQMMKTASGRAFASLPETYRIGFITIAPGSSVSSSRYLKIDDFTPGANNHRHKWYDKLYAQTRQTTGTPLREALSRVGQIYAGKFGSGYLTNGISENDDPVKLSCQSNFAILSTDGYWNGNGGRDIDNKALGDIDGVEDANWSRTQDGVYDKLKSANTLADAALYYYKTDLRPDMENNVRQSSRSTAQHQHMVTFTLGLGLDGTLTYDRNYENQKSGDFVSIKQGNPPWPKPVQEEPSALDDLWHAAVNGRGRFFSASDPQELALGLADTLTALNATTGANAAAATSSMQPVSGDNFAFTAEYRTVEWSGDLKARTIDLTGGRVAQVPLWSARELLDAKPWETRRIYTWDADDATGAGANRMKSFCWPGATDAVCNDGAGLSEAEQAYFNPTQLVQYPSLTDEQKEEISGQKIVDYVRGERANEMAGTSEDNELFRERASVLGDFVSAQPVYLKASDYSYTDDHYAAFRTCTTGYAGAEGTQPACDSSRFPHYPKARRGSVFAAANDGMLHAFETDVNDDPYYQTGGIATPETGDDTFTGDNAGNGNERWAYIPGLVLPRLAKLAESPYTHRYFTDGSPQVGDVCTGSCSSVADWRTILVGGLNAGGRGYYALDITNPENPKALWEFTASDTCLTDDEAKSGSHGADCHLGYTFGNPLITKRKADGKWVVIVTSGHNNFAPGSGKGYLYILDAHTGKILRRIGTGVGSAGVAADHADANPAGLTKINGWVENPIDNTTLAVYGADLLGNLWKFELDNERSGYLTAIKLATLADAGGNAQPVTAKPELAYVNGYRVVYVGTGKYLGLDDPGNTAQQTVYAIRDDLSGSSVDARSQTVGRTLGSGDLEDTRKIVDQKTVNWSTDKGWHVDLPDTGERVNVDPKLQLGTLIVASNVPHESVCTSGGYSYLNFFNIIDGSSFVVEGSLLSSRKIGDSMIVGISVIQLPGGEVKVITTKSSGGVDGSSVPTPAAAFQGRRVSWRELIDAH